MGMFQETPDVSVELEWMLQNRPVSPKRLTEALITREYARILRLTCSLMVDFGRAQRAAVDTFASVLLNTRPYWGETSLTVWLDSLAVEACQNADPKPQKPPSHLPNPTIEPHMPGDLVWQAIGSLPESCVFRSS